MEHLWSYEPYLKKKEIEVYILYYDLWTNVV